jgi:hypothetical protein
LAIFSFAVDALTAIIGGRRGDVIMAIRPRLKFAPPFFERGRLRKDFPSSPFKVSSMTDSKNAATGTPWASACSIARASISGFNSNVTLIVFTYFDYSNEQRECYARLITLV